MLSCKVSEQLRLVIARTSVMAMVVVAMVAGPMASAGSVTIFKDISIY